MKNALVVAFAFGVPETILSNKRISQIASKKAREVDAFVYTQRDIIIGESGVRVVYTRETHGNPPPTLRIARGAVLWAKRNAIERLWVVAAKPHIKRVIRDMRLAVRESGADMEIHVCFEEIEKFAADSWFCQDSAQERTRSRKEWEKRERILMLMPRFIYKYVAS